MVLGSLATWLREQGQTLGGGHVRVLDRAVGSSRVVVGTCSYLSLLVLLRVSGKRTLAKLNAFDFVVIVALGSTLSSVLLSSDVALAEGVTAMVLLVGLQFLVAWLSVRSGTVPTRELHDRRAVRGSRHPMLGRR